MCPHTLIWDLNGDEMMNPVVENKKTHVVNNLNTSKRSLTYIDQRSTMFLCSVQLHAYVRIGGSIPHKRENHEQPNWDYSNTKWRHAGAVEFLLPSGKLTWQWKMDLLKMYSLLKMGDFPLPC